MNLNMKIKQLFCLVFLLAFVSLAICSSLSQCKQKQFINFYLFLSETN